MRNVVDVSSFFLAEATGDSEAVDRPDHGSDDNTDDHVEMDAVSQSSKSKTTRADHHVFGRRRRQVKCCVRAWIQDYCCRCRRIFHKVEDDDDDAQEEEDDDDEDEEEVSSEVKKVTSVNDSHHHITMAVVDDDEKEKSRRFWETCLAS